MAKSTITVWMRGRGYKAVDQVAVIMSNLAPSGKLVVVLDEGWNEEHARMAIEMAEQLLPRHKLVLKVGRKTIVVKSGASVGSLRKALKL